MLLGLLALLFAALPAGMKAQAHNQAYSVAKITFDGEGGYEAMLACFVPALILGLPQGHLTPEIAEGFVALPEAEVARRIGGLTDYLREALEIRVDGKPLPVGEIEFPDLATLREDALVPVEDARPSAPITVRGRLPQGARMVEIVMPLELGQVMASFQNAADGTTIAQILSPGQPSHPFVLERGLERGELRLEIPGFLVTIGQFTAFGFSHIVPTGTDHILFVLGLFLFMPQWRPLGVQVTAFTLAHTVTLALSTFGLIALPAVVVEPLIALSIVAVALDNLVSTRLARWRTALVFAFGLLHGVGFASALKRAGLPEGEEALALVSFNVGVELGQIAVLAAAFAAVGWFIARPWYRARVVVPSSLAIAAFGAYWTIERLIANL